MLEMCAARFLETGLYKVKNNRVQPKISNNDIPQSVKINSSRIDTLALLLITNFDVRFFLIMLEFSSYWRFCTHFGLSKSIEFYEGFQKLSILLGFLPLSLGILIWAKWNFFTITNFRFFTFLLNYSIIIKMLKIVISSLERFWKQLLNFQIMKLKNCSLLLSKGS